jgi:hypothetical protein
MDLSEKRWPTHEFTAPPSAMMFTEEWSALLLLPLPLEPFRYCRYGECTFSGVNLQDQCPLALSPKGIRRLTTLLGGEFHVLAKFV